MMTLFYFYYLYPMRKLLALSSLAAIMLSACGGSTSDSGKITVGMITALTGDAAALGADQLSGVKMAVEAINASGGINGRQVELIVEDGKCSGSDGASAAQKLVNVDRVSVIIGGLCSSETLAAAPIVEAAKVVLFSPSSSSPDVTDAGEYVFRNYPSDVWRTKSMAKYFAEAGFKKVAILSENTDYSQAQRDSLKKDLPAGSVVFDESVDPGTKDFRSILTRLKTVEFDVFFTNANSDALNAVIIQQYREQNLAKPIVGADTTDSNLVPQVAGKDAEGVKIVDVPTAGGGSTFEADFTAKYGEPKSNLVWGAYAFDAANILFEAMKSVGTDGMTVKDYLYGMQPYVGIVGTYSFDKNGDPVGVSYVLKEIKDGKIVTIKSL